MDFLTGFKVLKDKNEKVTGFRIDPGPATEDWDFCEDLPKNLLEGRAEITISMGKICVESSGISGKERWEFNLSENEEVQFEEILSGLGKSYQGHCELERGFRCSFIASFKEVASLNKRELGKRKRSFWRNPIPTKDPTKVFNWKRIYT